MEADPGASGASAAATVRSGYDSLMLAGHEAHRAGDSEAAARFWTEANVLAPEAPEPRTNLGTLALADSAPGRAAEHLVAALKLHVARAAAEEFHKEEDAAWASELARLHDALAAAGRALILASRSEEAAEALGPLLDAFPHSMARYDYAVALHNTRQWKTLYGVVEPLVRTEALNADAWKLLYTAQVGYAESEDVGEPEVVLGGAMFALMKAEGLPFTFTVTALDHAARELRGTLTNRSGPEGSAGTLVFELFGPLESLGMVDVPVQAPAVGTAVQVVVPLPAGPLIGWSYTLR